MARHAQRVAKKRELLRQPPDASVFVRSWIQIEDVAHITLCHHDDAPTNIWSYVMVLFKN
jgi:hypothetical protein